MTEVVPNIYLNEASLAIDRTVPLHGWYTAFNFINRQCINTQDIDLNQLQMVYNN